MATESHLAHARYGKDKIRVFRIVREGKWHHVVEYNVCALLEGNIDISYTQADNSVVVATDSIKNITYYLAKTSPHILHPERFALHLGSFLVNKYAHIHKAFVTIEKLRWKRIEVEDGKEHPHSFYRDGDDVRITKVEIDGTQGKDKLIAKVSAGIQGLLVLKSTGSAFESFVRDEFTTLTEVSDRIFSTSIDLTYTYAPFPIVITQGNDGVVAPAQEKFAGKGSAWDGESVAEDARKVTLETFAVDESASVQATLYKMAQKIIAQQPFVNDVEYALPNKHYVPVDLKYLGLENIKPLSTFPFSPPCISFHISCHFGLSL
ncbi:hypothetical protein EIP91_007864 [Steccherinum ochraceum]|uniref:Uricase n=1 Tax=Steccherinum ochraceum TaxID=92696 RepID=A0A4R0RBU8_9APHY|nr:hypothetical protein EIP91_007864 [Steccherinum ochraceum]